MLKILILDDEQLILEALYQYFVKKRIDMYETFAAENAEKAFQIVETKRVDILITDIEMPDEDGLTLHRKICTSYPTCKVVFFTAHAKFDYAYYANQYNTKLVLKSDGFERLLEIVDQIADEIKKELLDNSNTQQGSLYTPVDMSGLKYLSWAESEQALQQARLSIVRESPCYFILIRKPFTNHDDKCIVDKIIGMILQHFQPYYLVDVFEFSKNDILVAFQLKQSSDRSKCELHIDNLLELLHPMLCEKIGLNIQIALSKCFLQLETIFEQYQILCKMLGGYSDNGMELICKESARNAIENNILACDRQLLQDLMLENIQGISNEVNRLLQLCDSQTNQQEKLIKSHLNFIISTYIEKSSEWENASVTIAIKKLFNTDLRQLDKGFVMDLLLSVISNGSEIKQYEIADNSNGNLIFQIDRFIQDNYYQDISLSDIADHVYLSPTYISKIYKQETGKNIVNRIQQIRLYRSVYLLQNSNMKVSDISAAVGFTSARYFITLFKKWKGITPKQFRENHDNIFEKE